jgi:hypothetical protein
MTRLGGTFELCEIAEYIPYDLRQRTSFHLPLIYPIAFLSVDMDTRQASIPLLPRTFDSAVEATVNIEPSSMNVSDDKASAYRLKDSSTVKLRFLLMQ